MALVTYDPDAKAMYISLDKKKVRVAKTISLGEGKYLDVTETNEPVGLEIISFQERFHKKPLMLL